MNGIIARLILCANTALISVLGAVPDKTTAEWTKAYEMALKQQETALRMMGELDELQTSEEDTEEIVTCLKKGEKELSGVGLEDIMVSKNTTYETTRHEVEATDAVSEVEKRRVVNESEAGEEVETQSIPETTKASAEVPGETQLCGQDQEGSVEKDAEGTATG